MSANTTPDNIVYPVVGDQIAPLETVFSAMATSVQNAFNGYKKNFNSAVATQAARNALFTAPVQGNSVYRLDLGITETYYGLYNAATNPGGATPAGWYPASGDIGMYSVKTAAQSFATGVGVLLTFDTVEGYGITASAGAYTIQTAGWYRVTAHIGAFSTAAGSDRWLYITKNSTTTAGQLSNALTNGGSSTFALLSTSVVVPLAAGDVIRSYALQNSGATLTLSEGQFALEFVSRRKY